MLTHTPLFVGLKHRFAPPGPAEYSGYRVFTRVFDETVNASDLSKILPKQSPRQLKSFADAGSALDSEFSSERIAFGATAAKLVRDLQESFTAEERKKSVVSILIDHSGSMRGLRMLSALLAVDIAIDALANAGVDTEILGFTTVGWKGGRARRAWRWAGRPPNPGRLCDIRHIVYGDADRSSRLPWNLRLALRSDLLYENIDGEALEWAGSRLDPGRWDRRIVCVISDGAPVDDSTLLANADRDLLTRHLDATEKKLRSTGIVVGFLLIGRENAREPNLCERASEPQAAGLSLLALIRQALIPGSIQVAAASNAPSDFGKALQSDGGIVSHRPSALSPRLVAKLASLGTRIEQSDHELEDVLAELSSLPANLVVRASREIAAAARLGWWQPQTLPQRVVAVSRPRLVWRRFMFKSTPRRVHSDQELLEINHNYAWLFLFHPNGYLREAALDRITAPPTSPFFFSALAWRLNDWVGAVRKAAERCAARILDQTDFEVAAAAALYLLDRRHAWGRWSDESKVLDRAFERKEVIAALAIQLQQRATGPLAACVRHALQYPNVDEHLPRLAAAAVQPSVRAVAYQCLISGKATWSVGWEWAWIDKVYGLRRRVPKLATRDIGRIRPAAEFIREAACDKSPFVRKVAADALIAARSQLPDEEALISHMAEDRSSAIRSRADFMRRHPPSTQP
jgi:hypothetical protein